MLKHLLNAMQPPRGRAWHGGPTPVGCLRGVTAAEARWVPAPGRHSIWELALHIAYWDYAVRRHLEPVPDRFPRSPANWPALPERPDERAWARDRRLLAQEHDQLVRATRRFGTQGWSRLPPGARTWRYGDLIVGILSHEVYHAGQIQLMKRLYRNRSRLR
jgi:uncharacterized damage-inducible protein DinB